MFLNQEKTDSTIKQLHTYLDFAKLKVNSKLFSTFERGTSKLKLNEFFNKKKSNVMEVNPESIMKVSKFVDFLLSD